MPTVSLRENEHAPFFPRAGIHGVARLRVVGTGGVDRSGAVAGFSRTWVGRRDDALTVGEELCAAGVRPGGYSSRVAAMASSISG